MSRHGLECPGDTIPYNCLIQSNSEALHLIWHLTFPDSRALIEIIFNGSSTSLAHETRLNGYVNASLIAYTEDMYIESSLVITVQPNASMNQLFLQCLIEDQNLCSTADENKTKPIRRILVVAMLRLSQTRLQNPIFN